MMKGISAGTTQTVGLDGRVDPDSGTVIVFLWDTDASIEEAADCESRHAPQYALLHGGSHQNKPATGELKDALEHYTAWLDARVECAA